MNRDLIPSLLVFLYALWGGFVFLVLLPAARKAGRVHGFCPTTSAPRLDVHASSGPSSGSVGHLYRPALPDEGAG